MDSVPPPVVLWTDGEPREPLLDVGLDPLLPLHAWSLRSEPPPPPPPPPTPLPSPELPTLELTVGESMAATSRLTGCESLVTDGTDCAYGLQPSVCSVPLTSALGYELFRLATDAAVLPLATAAAALPADDNVSL